jgi:hypothetical protein
MIDATDLTTPRLEVLAVVDAFARNDPDAATTLIAESEYAAEALLLQAVVLLHLLTAELGVDTDSVRRYVLATARH